MTAENTFDLLVIGAGPAGYVCAIRAAQLGLKTACVESSQTLGGTCLNVGCIPSKALLESSHHFHKVNHELEGHGIIVSKAKLDLKKMLERKNHVVSSMTQGVDFLLKKNKVTRLTGKASFISTTEVKITDGKKSTTVKAEKTVIATGSEPIELPFAPFDHEYIVDSSDALNFSKVPKDLVIIGGGVIGLELGSVWQRLGSNVTVIEFSSKLMGKTDKQMSSTMQRILEKQGLKIYLESKAQKIEIKGKKAQVSFDKKGTSQTFQADKVLIAVGRKANTKDLNLAKIGLSLDKQGKIAVSKNWQTVKPNIFAIGDVTHGPMLAHKASDEGIAVAEHIAGKTSHVNYDAIPSIVYTHPELASVGLSEESCKEEKIPYNVGKFNFKANGRAKAMGEDSGLVKIIAHKETDKLLGFHIVGANASEMIAEAALAFEYGASAEDIARSVHAHPTLAEAMKEAALDVEKRAIHS